MRRGSSADEREKDGRDGRLPPRKRLRSLNGEKGKEDEFSKREEVKKKRGKREGGKK